VSQSSTHLGGKAALDVPPGKGPLQTPTVWPKAIISNGLNRFHLAVAAAEVAQYDGLALMLTAGYPTKRFERAATFFRFASQPRIARLIDRREHIPDHLVKPLWRSELLGQLGSLARGRPTRRLAERLDDAALKSFARGAARHLRHASIDAGIYHYRSGFGLGSVGVARNAGLLTLCDHSIVHPLALGELLAVPTSGLSKSWKTVLRDLDQADHVVVNSDFVKSTFLEQGWDPARVDVVYWGIDDGFLATVPERLAQPKQDGPLRLLFAGSFERRKGADVLVAGLSGLEDVSWRLEIAGPLPSEVRTMHRRFLEDPRVTHLGTVPRGRLAATMAANDVFVFPSLAEGSARVVFEALACGLYVVTTPNAGSVVEDGVHGALVPAHAAEALTAALWTAAEDRSRLQAVGLRNAAFVRDRYRQRDYGKTLLALYADLGDRGT
jgi:glycosyltransferase involved in cell wall biosynthesis